MSLFKSAGGKIFEKSPLQYAEEIFGEHYSIPAFQRNYVWAKDTKKTPSLLESIYKGFNIGTIIFWDSTLIGISRSKDNLNPTVNSKNEYSYILDGQQRTLTMISLFSKNMAVEVPLKRIIIELNKKTGKLNISNKLQDPTTISMNYLDFKNKILFDGIEKFNFITSFMNGGFPNDIVDAFSREIKQLYANILGKKLIIGYKLTLSKSDLGKAIDQFEKINQAGTKLSDFEILDAVAYISKYKLSDQSKSFDQKFAGIIDGSRRFTKDSEKIILNSYKLIKNYRQAEKNKQIEYSLNMKAIANYEAKDSEILNSIITNFRDVSSELFAMGLSSLKNVPYTPNITLYIFMKTIHPELMVNITDRDFLYTIMFQTGIMKSYEKSASQMLIKHIKSTITALASNTSIKLKDPNTLFELNALDILNTDYTKIKALEKAIFLYFINTLEPKDFITKHVVKLANFSHKKSNMDHIFPKAKYSNVVSINSLSNLALIEARTNKQKLASSPSGFFIGIPFDDNEEMYLSQNIDREMWDSLIKDEVSTFINNRAKLLAEQLNDHLNDISNG